MGGARGREGVGRNRALCVGERWNHVAPVERRGGPAIEANEANVGMYMEEGAKVVRDGIVRYIRIKTSRTSRGRKHIPQRDVMVDQSSDATRIIGG